MAIMSPSAIPPDCNHLDTEEQELIRQLQDHLEAGRYHEGQDTAEDLWRLAVDAHKALWKGVSNALTAVCARELGHLKGAQDIAARTHEMLVLYPRRVVGIDLDLLLVTMDRFVATGSGEVRGNEAKNTGTRARHAVPLRLP
jgi:hypothetical protein